MTRAAHTYARSEHNFLQRRRGTHPARRSHGVPVRGLENRRGGLHRHRGLGQRRSRSGASPPQVQRCHPPLPQAHPRRAAMWMRLFNHHLSNGVGLIAAWAADEDLLGRSALVNTTPEQAGRSAQARATPLGLPRTRRRCSSRSCSSCCTSSATRTSARPVCRGGAYAAARSRPSHSPSRCLPRATDLIRPRPPRCGWPSTGRPPPIRLRGFAVDRLRRRARRWPCSAGSASGTCSRRSSSAAGWATRGRAAFLDAGERPRSRGVRRASTRALELIRRHIAAGGADRRARRLRRRRRVRDRDHGPRAAQPRRRRRLVPARAASTTATAWRRRPCERLAAARHRRSSITVDCGITAVEEVAAARAAGLDVVVTDHHAPRADGVLPDCPIVHPAALRLPVPDAVRDRRWRYKLAERARRAAPPPTTSSWWRWPPSPTSSRCGTRTAGWCAQGLAALAATAKPGLRALMAVSRADPSALDTGTLGFRLAPRINAAGRLRRADAGLELLLTEDAGRAQAIAARARCRQRGAPRRRAADPVGGRGPGRRRSAPARRYVLAAEDWHPGVVGIVASRIVERHHRPTVLMALGRRARRPARAAASPASTCSAALHACAGHLLRYGGHRAAAGLTHRRRAARRVPRRVRGPRRGGAHPGPARAASSASTRSSPGAELGLDLAEELAPLEPCGMGNPAPRLLVPGARFDDVRPMGEGRHARFTVDLGRRAGPRGRVRLRRPASAEDSPSRWMRPSAWSATPGTARSSPGWCCATRGPVRRTPIAVVPGEPDDYLAVGVRRGRRGAERQSHASGLRGSAPARAVRRPPRAQPAGGARGRGRRRRPRCWPCAPTSPRRLPGLRERVGGFTLAAYGDARGRPVGRARLRPHRRARPARQRRGRPARCAPEPGSPTGLGRA